MDHRVKRGVWKQKKVFGGPKCRPRVAEASNGAKERGDISIGEETRATAKYIIDETKGWVFEWGGVFLKEQKKKEKKKKRGRWKQTWKGLQGRIEKGKRGERNEPKQCNWVRGGRRRSHFASRDHEGTNRAYDEWGPAGDTTSRKSRHKPDRVNSEGYETQKVGKKTGASRRTYESHYCTRELNIREGEKRH